MTAVTLTVNGRRVTAEVEPRTHLADFLRDTLDLTGTHTGCEHGVCGACTILVDGVPVRSCITLTVSCDSAEVRTIEDLDDDEVAGELRAAFSRHHGLQCGYCTPGMMVSARDVVLRLEAGDERDIRLAMSGNLCRCTGYVGIVQAIREVIAARRSRGIAAIRGGGRTRLGPGGSGHAGVVTAPSAPAADLAPAPAPASTSAAGAAAAVRLDGDWQPQQTLARSFAVAHPPGEVWELFGDVEAVAACLPGAAITGTGADGRVDGRIRVRLGPISAEFRGAAVIGRDDAARSGTIEGKAVDGSSRSATRGRIRYAVRPGDRPGATRVDIEVGFTLTGALAQFGRSGVVEDLAGRIVAVFAHNLERRLSGDGGALAAAPQLDAGVLMRSMAATFVTGLIRRLFGPVRDR